MTSTAGFEAAGDPAPPDAAEGPAGGHLVWGASWVMAGFLVNAATGLVFWVLAARLYDPDQVGAASALWASMQFVNYVAALGVPESLSRHHQLDRQLGGAIFAWGVLATVLACFLASVVYLSIIAPDSADHLDSLGALTGPTFAVLAAGTSLVLLVDLQLMTDRRWRTVFARFLVSGTARLPLVFLGVIAVVPLRLLVAISAPVALSGIIGAVVIPRWNGVGARLKFDQRLREPVRFAAVNYVSHLAYLAPQFVIPIIVLVNVSDEENAAFFIAWTFTVVLSILPLTISRVLLIESGHEESSLGEETRRAMFFAVGLMAVALAGGILARPLISWVFGPAYDEIVELLPFLLLGQVPAAVSTVLIGYARARDDHVSSIVIPGVLAGATVGLAAVLVPTDGADGAAWAWLAGNTMAAVVAVVLLGRGPATAAIQRVLRRGAPA